MAGENSTPELRTALGDRICRQFIEAVSKGTATLSAIGDILSCNAALGKTLRRPPDQVLGTVMQDHVLPDDHEIFSAVLAQAGQESRRRKIHLKTSENLLVPVYLSATLLRSAGMEPVICLVFTDLEEVISAEEALRESEERFRATFEQAAVGIAHAAPDGRWLQVNQKLADIVGYTREELMAKSFREITYPDDLETDLEYLQQVLAGEISTFCMEKRYIRKDASIVWINLTVSLVRKPSGEPGYFIAVIEDISSRKRADAALQDSEERHRTILQTALDGFWMVDTQGRLLEVNETYCRMSGYSAQELLAMRIPDLEVLETAEETAARIRQIMTKGEHRFESRHRRKDGSVFDVEISVQYRPAEGGRIATFLRDVTEHIRLAEERARLEDQLWQAKKVEAIGRLAGGVAHDFNNLTAIILGYGEMLLGQLSPGNPARKSVEQIIAAGRRSAALTHQLLAFSRKQTLQPEVLDLNALLRNLEKMLGRLIGEDIELEFRLAAHLGRVMADPGQLEQVVTNLVLNARDAMPRGGRLTLESADVELDETYALGHTSVVPGKYVLLALTDTGCGMDKATMARLFEPFFTTKETGKGTGLGLATVYGIVKQSGGYIWVYSEPDKGSTFKVYLPRTDAEPQAKAVEAGGDTPRGDGERILLVEDEASLRELCEIVLSGLGYRVSAAGSGTEALRLVEEQRLEPNLVVTDVVMPGMSGTELAERLRRDRSDLKVLYMSGYPDDAIARHGILDPGIPFIQKPFTERALAVHVREALKGTVVAPGKRILMIDDDDQFRDLVRHYCTKQGHVFAGASDSAAALAVLVTQSFDVLLVDLNIPGTSGEHILREIRAAGHTTPAIVLTGDAASADMGALRPLGVVRTLQKSSDAAPLLQAIKEAGER